MGKLISKYNISDVDLYKLGRVETKKKSSSWFEKEKLKAVTLKILKPYNVSFMDLGNLGSEIKKGNFKSVIKWLRSNIHNKGSEFYIDELMKKITGEKYFYLCVKMEAAAGLAGGQES